MMEFAIGLLVIFVVTAVSYMVSFLASVILDGYVRTLRFLQESPFEFGLVGFAMLVFIGLFIMFVRTCGMLTTQIFE